MGVLSDSNNSFCPIQFALLLSINLYSFSIIQGVFSIYNSSGGSKELASLVSPNKGNIVIKKNGCVLSSLCHLLTV